MIELNLQLVLLVLLRDKVRPVLINHWEAFHFDINEKLVEKIANEVSELGIDLFVLDDGWFKGRNNDRTSLGDWFVDEKEFPNGLVETVKKVNANGI